MREVISLASKESCTGCAACASICSKGCIKMVEDREGFLQPKIDYDSCVACHKCEKTCPIISPLQNPMDRLPLVYAAYSKDESIRLDSTSGGLFSELAKTFLQEGDYVGGAVYNEDHTVSQIITNDISRLPELRSSKYLQSNAEGVYQQIKQVLVEGKRVLFCGSPCYVSALHNYLGKKYANLTTIDFICRGANSPKVFVSYMNMLERQYGSKATSIKFKNKKWGWHRFSMRVSFANGKEYCQDRYHDLFFVGYLQAGNFCRRSCYQCQFKGFPQASDITLADFWGIEDLDKSMDQDKGTSLVLVNTEKGKALFDSIKGKIVYKSFSAEVLKNNQAANTSLTAAADDREEFFNALETMPFEDVAEKFFPKPQKIKKVSIMRKLWRKVKKIRRLWPRLGCSMNNFWAYIKLNHFSKQIVHAKNCRILPLSNHIVQLDEDAKIVLNGNLVVGDQQVKGARQQTRIWLEKGAELHVDGDFTIGADSYIRVWQNSKLVLHNGFFNEHVQVTAGDIVEIGDGCAIGRDVVIRSYDGHTILDDNYQISKPITIGNHVWIGQGASILKGVTINDGAIVAANAVVTKDVPSQCAVAGNPAKVVKEGMKWEE